MTTDTYRPNFDLNEVKNIPILDVCDYLNLSVQKKGKNYWCRVRPEKTPSVILHTDNNTFYDFGNAEHGSNIDLVCYATGLSFSEALQALGEAFHLHPEHRYSAQKRYRVMSIADYARIGLYADLATKNFTFPVERYSIERLMKIEQRYKMTMNELRQKHPKIYERIIKEKAIPCVNRLRNLYYLDIWKYYNFLETFKRSYLFYESDKTTDRFKSRTEELERAEKALYKACYGTALNVCRGARYDPIRVLNRLRRGRLNISLGSHTPEELVQLFSGKISSVTIEHDLFFRKEIEDYLSQISCAVIFSWDEVEVKSHPENIQKLQTFINNISLQAHKNSKKSPLSFQIKTAEEKTSSNKQTSDNKTVSFPHER